MATSDGSVKAPEELGLERSQAAAAPEKRPKRHYKNIRTDFPVLEQRVTDLTLELQRARSEREAHQTLHGALVMLERYQSNLLQAGARAGLRLPEDGAGAGQELRGPDASQPAAPGFFQGLFGRIHLAFPRLKQNMTLALIRGGFYVPTDDELRSFVVTLDENSLLERNEIQREWLVSLMAEWEKSPDAGVRAKIEARMRNFRDLRTKFLRSFIRHRPEVLPKALTLRVTPAPEDCSAEERGTCSSLLHPSLAAVEQMPWTGEEREGVLLAWDAYCRRTAAIRQRASVELDAMATSSALRSIYAWEATDNNRSLCHLMGAYTELANSVGGCEAWMRLEVLAYAEFFCACVEAVEPVTAIKLHRMALPYIVDCTQVCRWLLSVQPTAGGGGAPSSRGAASQELASAARQ